MTLKFVKPHPDPHMNVLLYGPPKTGKTIGAASAPGPILYLNADRPNATRLAHEFNPDKLSEAKVEGLQTLVDATTAIESGDFKTVVLDPIGEVYRTVLDDLSGRAMRPKIQDYGDTGTHLERFCRHLCEQPVNFVIVAHDTAIKDEETGGFEHLPYTGTNNPALGAKLMAMVDVIGYCGVVTDDEGQTSYLAQLENGAGRRGGDRFGVLGRTRALDLADWIEAAKMAATSNHDE